MQKQGDSEVDSTLTSTRPQIVIKATARLGTVFQKSLTLNEPLSLIGSNPQAHLALPGADVDAMHAAVINNGSDVLLADLCSSTGTHCAGDRVRVRVLDDGDVVRIGTVDVRFDITRPRCAAAAAPSAQPATDPLERQHELRLIHVESARCWEIRDSVAIIGSSPQAHVVLDDPDIAPAHCLLFAGPDGETICDLGTAVPLKINGQHKRSLLLHSQDRILIGKVGLMVRLSPDHDAKTRSANARAGLPTVRAEEPVQDQGPAAPGALCGLEDRVTALQQELVQSWSRINSSRQELAAWHDRLTDRERELGGREQQLIRLGDELESRAEELARRDGVLGQREGELHNRTELLERKRLEMQSAEQALTNRASQIGRRESELEGRCTELTNLAAELETRRDEIDQFAMQYEAQRRELEALQARIENERAGVAADREAVEQLSDQLASRLEQLAEREHKLTAAERAHKETVAEVQAARQDVEHRHAAIDERMQQLVEYEGRLEARCAELSDLQKDQHNQRRVIERFSTFLNEANEAYGLTFKVPFASPEAVEVAANQSERANGHGRIPTTTRGQFHAVVHDLEQHARQMMGRRSDGA